MAFVASRKAINEQHYSGYGRSLFMNRKSICLALDRGSVPCTRPTYLLLEAG